MRQTALEEHFVTPELASTGSTSTVAQPQLWGLWVIASQAPPFRGCY